MTDTRTLLGEQGIYQRLFVLELVCHKVGESDVSSKGYTSECLSFEPT